MTDLAITRDRNLNCIRNVHQAKQQASMVIFIYPIFHNRYNVHNTKPVAYPGMLKSDPGNIGEGWRGRGRGGGSCPLVMGSGVNPGQFFDK